MTPPDISCQKDAQRGTTHTAKSERQSVEAVSCLLILDENLADDRVLQYDQPVRDDRPKDDALGKRTEVCSDDEEGKKLGRKAKSEQPNDVLWRLDLGDEVVEDLRYLKLAEEILDRWEGVLD